MKKYKFEAYIVTMSVLGILLTLALSSCATWRSNSVSGYEVTGAILAEIRSTSRSLCDAGQISEADCEKIKVHYMKVRVAYITAGDALISAINTADQVKHKQYMNIYVQSINDVGKYLPELLRICHESKVYVSGGK